MSKQKFERVLENPELEHELIVIAEVVAALDTIRGNRSMDRVLQFVADRYGFSIDTYPIIDDEED